MHPVMTSRSALMMNNMKPVRLIILLIPHFSKGLASIDGVVNPSYGAGPKTFSKKLKTNLSCYLNRSGSGPFAGGLRS
jgi:hypothetical protein